MPRATKSLPPVPSQSVQQVELGPALEFMRGLWRLNHAIELTSGHMERTVGITAQQRMIIRCIGKRPGIAPSQLAALLHLDRSTISSALSRMARDRLLTRRSDERDRRSVALWLTPKGRKLDQPSKETLEHAVECMLADTSPRDRQAATRVMECLAQALECMLLETSPRPKRPVVTIR